MIGRGTFVYKRVVSTPRLVTIPISHYCEKARWALERAGVPYVEEGHAPVLHWGATFRLHTRTVPVLIATGTVLKDSTAILRWADARSTGAHLYPDDPSLRREVEELEDHFDKMLGPATRRWAYSFLLPDRRRALELLGAGIPDSERKTLVALYPFISRLMKRGMNVTPAAAARSLARAQAIFVEVSARLRDGRRYLVGDSFTAADLTFAALSTPVICPPQCAFMPIAESLPPAMLREVQAFRATEAGRFVLRMFREERPRYLPKVA